MRVVSHARPISSPSATFPPSGLPFESFVFSFFSLFSSVGPILSSYFEYWSFVGVFEGEARVSGGDFHCWRMEDGRSVRVRILKGGKAGKLHCMFFVCSNGKAQRQTDGSIVVELKTGDVYDFVEGKSSKHLPRSAAPERAIVSDVSFCLIRDWQLLPVGSKVSFCGVIRRCERVDTKLSLALVDQSLHEHSILVSNSLYDVAREGTVVCAMAWVRESTAVRSGDVPVLFEPASCEYPEAASLKKWWSQYGAGAIRLQMQKQKENLPKKPPRQVSSAPANAGGGGGGASRTTALKRNRVELDAQEELQVKKNTLEVLRTDDEHSQFVNHDDKELEEYEAHLVPLQLSKEEIAILPREVVEFFAAGHGPQVDPSHDGWKLAWNWDERSVRSLLKDMASMDVFSDKEKKDEVQARLMSVLEILVEVREKIIEEQRIVK